jgi:DCN1-like protein 1/2
MEKLRKRCETLDSEIKDKWKFKDFYQFTFNFAKNPGQKSLGMCDTVWKRSLSLN